MLNLRFQNYIDIYNEDQSGTTFIDTNHLCVSFWKHQSLNKKQRIITFYSVSMSR